MEPARVQPVPTPEPAVPPVFERRLPLKPFQLSTAYPEAGPVATPCFRTDLDDSEEDRDLDRRRWLKFAPVWVGSLLVIIFLGARLITPGRPTLAKQTVVPAQAADTDAQENNSKPSPSTLMGSGRNASAAKIQTALGSQPEAVSVDYLPSQQDSQLMNDQLSAAPRISRDITAKPREEAPPAEGFNTANIDAAAAASAIDGAFGTQARPTVRYVPYPMVTVPPAVAESLLIQKTLPTYPKSAWYAGQTGKVQLEIKVSRTGSVESVHLIAGPRVFQQAALDAVKTWLFRPYVVDDVAREFQSTIEVIFDQTNATNPLSFLHFGSRAQKSTSASAVAKGTEPEAQ
jgi:TonB family protein